MTPDYTPEIWQATAEAISEVLGCSADALAPHADLDAGMDEIEREELANALEMSFEIPYCESAFREFSAKAKTPHELAQSVQIYLDHTDAGYYWRLKLQAQAQGDEL